MESETEQVEAFAIFFKGVYDSGTTTGRSDISTTAAAKTDATSPLDLSPQTVHEKLKSHKNKYRYKNKKRECFRKGT